MKKVNMLKIAQLISDKTEIVGLRPGEKLSETLVSAEEAKKCSEIGEYLVIRPYSESLESSQVTFSELSSQTAVEMSQVEMLELLRDVNSIGGSTNLDLQQY